MRVGAFQVDESVSELRDAHAIAVLRPWIDVGRVGTLVLNQLEQHLQAKEMARLARPGDFFDFTRYRPRIRLTGEQRIVTVPNTPVYRGRQDDRDYVFIHIREPHMRGEDYVDAIFELLQHCNVSEYCRIGGMYDSVPHTRPLMITGTLTGEQEERAGGLVSHRAGTYQGPTSIISLLGEMATGAGISTPSLMAHIPQYVQLDEDHMGASRLMQVLCTLYGFPESLADPARGLRQYQEIERAVGRNPQLQALIKQLEGYYDRVQAGGVDLAQPEAGAPLSPEVEEFLREMGRRLDGGTS